jgi:hypothetical protein
MRDGFVLGEGSAMVVLASNFEIHDCIIQDNGRGMEAAPFPPGLTPWSDGMTVLLCQNGFIHTNYLQDNTDIQLVVGGGLDCRVQNNTISSVTRHAFASLNVGNFNSNGNHSGAIYSGNVISSSLNLCIWGLLLGSYPWDTSVFVYDAGTVTNNSIQGAIFNLAVDGIGAGTS